MTASTFITVERSHEDCDECDNLIHAAKGIAACTGSVGARYSSNRNGEHAVRVARCEHESVIEPANPYGSDPVVCEDCGVEMEYAGDGNGDGYGWTPVDR